MYVAWQKDLPVYVKDDKSELEDLKASNTVIIDRITEVSFAEMWNGSIYLDPDELTQAQGDPIRAERDRRLAGTDYLMMPDYPLADADRERVKVYRQQLRDLPAAPAFPWGGDVDSVPWPNIPEITKA